VTRSYKRTRLNGSARYTRGHVGTVRKRVSPVPERETLKRTGNRVSRVARYRVRVMKTRASRAIMTHFGVETLAHKPRFVEARRFIVSRNRPGEVDSGLQSVTSVYDASWPTRAEENSGANVTRRRKRVRRV